LQLLLARQITQSNLSSAAEAVPTRAKLLQKVLRLPLESWLQSSYQVVDRLLVVSRATLQETVNQRTHALAIGVVEVLQ
jgi:hypothetical protein